MTEDFKPACPGDNPRTWFPRSALKLSVLKNFTQF
jgi:hypothetical protein